MHVIEHTAFKVMASWIPFLFEALSNMLRTGRLRNTRTVPLQNTWLMQLVRWQLTLTALLATTGNFNCCQCPKPLQYDDWISIFTFKKIWISVTRYRADRKQHPSSKSEHNGCWKINCQPRNIELLLPCLPSHMHWHKFECVALNFEFTPTYNTHTLQNTTQKVYWFLWHIYRYILHQCRQLYLIYLLFMSNKE